MNILGNIFSGGASDLVKNVGGVIDNLHTSKEEKLEAEKKIKDMIKVEGQWKEAGAYDFPWEDDANNGIEQNV